MVSDERQETVLVDTKFELCHDVDKVLQIGREFQKQDLYRGAHHDTAKLLCDTIEYLRECLNKPVGNAAAARKALIEIDRVVFDKRRHTKEEVEAHRLATEALTVPPRQCDVGTAEEQSERFMDFCRPGNRPPNCEKCKIYPKRMNKFWCQLEWAQTPYEAKEGAGK